MGDGLFSIPERRYSNASILCEMQGQKGNEGCQIYNYEEREASNSGCMPHMWDEDVQDREELELVYRYQDLQRGWVFLIKAQPLCYRLHIMQFCHIQALWYVRERPFVTWFVLIERSKQTEPAL